MTEQRAMTTMEWEHLVRDVLPRVRAARLLDAAESASVPHMTKEGRDSIVNRWTSLAMTQVREAARGVVDQLSAFRRFLKSAGIDPETGTDQASKGISDS